MAKTLLPCYSRRPEVRHGRTTFAVPPSGSFHHDTEADYVWGERFPVLGRMIKRRQMRYSLNSSLIEREACDDRDFVRKAVNRTLRQIGKRNMILGKRAIEIAGRIAWQDRRSAKWIAMDALRELRKK